MKSKDVSCSGRRALCGMLWEPLQLSSCISHNFVEHETQGEEKKAGHQRATSPSLYNLPSDVFAAGSMTKHMQSHDQCLIRLAERSTAGFWPRVFSQIGQIVSVPSFLCLLFDAECVFISCLDHLGIPSTTCGTVEDIPGTISGGGRDRNWEKRSDN